MPFNPPPEAVREAARKRAEREAKWSCPYLGDMLAADDAGTIARESVPCSTCGSKAGRKEYAVHECTAPDNAAGECIPYYRPTEKNVADYAAEGHRPRICSRCPHYNSGDDDAVAKPSRPRPRCYDGGMMLVCVNLFAKTSTHQLYLKKDFRIPIAPFVGMGLADSDHCEDLLVVKSVVCRDGSENISVWLNELVFFNSDTQGIIGEFEATGWVLGEPPTPLPKPPA